MHLKVLTRNKHIQYLFVYIMLFQSTFTWKTNGTFTSISTYITYNVYTDVIYGYMMDTTVFNLTIEP